MDERTVEQRRSAPPWTTPRRTCWTGSWRTAALRPPVWSPLPPPGKGAAGPPWPRRPSWPWWCARAPSGVTGWRAANAVDSVVMLDVNPSVSMSVNARERVLSVTALNQDAVTIIGIWT